MTAHPSPILGDSTTNSSTYTDDPAVSLHDSGVTPVPSQTDFVQTGASSAPQFVVCPVALPTLVSDSQGSVARSNSGASRVSSAFNADSIGLQRTQPELQDPVDVNSAVPVAAGPGEKRAGRTGTIAAKSRGSGALPSSIRSDHSDSGNSASGRGEPDFAGSRSRAGCRPPCKPTCAAGCQAIGRGNRR